MEALISDLQELEGVEGLLVTMVLICSFFWKMSTLVLSVVVDDRGLLIEGSGYLLIIGTEVVFLTSGLPNGGGVWGGAPPHQTLVPPWHYMAVLWQISCAGASKVIMAQYIVRIKLS